jgi:hypothetical protein
MIFCEAQGEDIAGLNRRRATTQKSILIDRVAFNFEIASKVHLKQALI